MGYAKMTVYFKDPTDAQSVGLEKFELAQGTGLSGLYRAFGKRAFDIAFVLAVAPLGLTLVFMGALLSAVGGGHWPFYHQLRVGRGGKVFRMLKIRTMVANADAHLETYLAENPEARREWDEKQKLENDPRITRFGNILRKSSLDEMPQLWNVLKGEMSIVGPRPMMVDQQELYPGTDYYMLRPGVTGPWQISDRSQGSFAGRARFDAAYNKTLSLKNDLHILAGTAGVVLRCTGR
ncbi:MAG: sugar transferase [Pseudomonadota bacterium]